MFLGDRYGYRPFPAKIEATEFEMLLDIAKEQCSDAYLILTSWFTRDENSIPPKYILQVCFISHIIILPHTCL